MKLNVNATLYFSYHMKVPASYWLDDFNSFFQMIEMIF